MGKEASEFSTSKNYAIGDLTMHNGVLFEFIQAHNAGAWDASHVAEYDNLVPQQIDRIVSGAKNATQACDYADTVVFEPYQVSETRYGYTFLNG